MAKPLTVLWDWLSECDPTLRLRSRELPVLKQKRLHRTSFQMAKAFAKMCAGEIAVFDGPAVPVSESPIDPEQLRRTLLRGLRTSFPRKMRARTQVGRKRNRRYLKLPELVKRWESEKAVLSVTDLHIRGTRFEQIIDTTSLSYFNILCTDCEFAAEFIDNIEMMTMVISARGNVTDSHTDDCDGTNHCFIGRKLWLAWDRVDGQRRGLQDTTRDSVYDHAAFDMSTFLSLPSATWFIVNSGDTLFLPGSFAHKVITLEPYIGVGSFNVTLPGALGTLSRWRLHGTTDIHRKQLLEKITGAVIRRVQLLRRASRKSKDAWGLPYLQHAVAQWRRHKPDKAKRLLLSDEEFKSFIDVASES
jgi:hypothetical protein